MNASTGGSVPSRELRLTRLIPAPRRTLYRAWTEPDLLRRWFAPAPWTIPEAALDVRPGGSTLVVMRNPGGEVFPMRGVYLEIVPDRRLVFTDAYTRAWEPSAKPFMTVVVSFEDEAEATLYDIRVLHWTEGDRRSHEDMGFYTGWGQCAEQLAALVGAIEAGQ